MGELQRLKRELQRLKGELQRLKRELQLLRWGLQRRKWELQRLEWEINAVHVEETYAVAKVLQAEALKNKGNGLFKAGRHDDAAARLLGRHDWKVDLLCADWH